MDFKKDFKRLLKTVKAELAKGKMPARNADIAATLGYNRTYLSGLLGKKGVVTKDHITLLKLHYPFLSENETRGTHGIENLILEEKEPGWNSGSDQQKYIRILERDRMFFESTLKENLNLMAANLTELLRSQRYDRAQLTTLLAVASRTLAGVEKRDVETVFEETNKAVNDQIAQQM